MGRGRERPHEFRDLALERFRDLVEPERPARTRVMFHRICRRHALGFDHRGPKYLDRTGHLANFSTMTSVMAPTGRTTERFMTRPMTPATTTITPAAASNSNNAVAV